MPSPERLLDSRPSTGYVRRRRRLVSTLRSALVAAGLVGALTATLVPGAAHASTYAGQVRSVAARTAGPQPGADFPLPPKRCQTGDNSNPENLCHVVIAGPRRPTMVGFGDSHLWMYLPAMVQAARQTHSNLVVSFAGGCPPVLPEPKTAQRHWTGCETHDQQTVDYVAGLVRRHHPVRLIVGAWWDGYRERYYRDQHGLAGSEDDSSWSVRQGQNAHDDTIRLFDWLGRHHVGTDVIAQAGIVPQDAPYCAAGNEPYQCFLPRSEVLNQEQGNRAWLRRQTVDLTRPFRTIDPSTVYCGPQRCRPDVHGVPTYYDDYHLGKHLTATMTSFFLPSFEALTGSSARSTRSH